MKARQHTNRRVRNLADLLDDTVIVEEVVVEPARPEPLFEHRLAELARTWGARLSPGAG